MQKAVFEGLVFDEAENPIPVVYVGNDPTYVVVDHGFKYHVDAQRVDDQVIAAFVEQMQANKGMVSDAIMKMMGKDDLFTKASVDSSLKNADKQMAQLHTTGIPEQAREYLGMMGFKIVIDRHGDIISLTTPSAAEPEE
ncbi:MAG TPA: hypothetical protein PLW39_12795 [Thermoflexales bacterium]|nr:hypothetical protein [Thermoflexales bacterium]HQZ23137.1 hypothetical protein [Thermoflexales bacterium]